MGKSKMKKMVVVGTAVVTLASVGLGTYANVVAFQEAWSTKYANIKAELEEFIATDAQKDAELVSIINNKNTRIKELKTEIETLEASGEDNTELIAELQAEKAQLETEKAELQTQLTDATALADQYLQLLNQANADAETHETEILAMITDAEGEAVDAETLAQEPQTDAEAYSAKWAELFGEGTTATVLTESDYKLNATTTIADGLYEWKGNLIHLNGTTNVVYNKETLEVIESTNIDVQSVQINNDGQLEFRRNTNAYLTVTPLS